MADKKNLISIIVPVYNTAQYLEDCVESIINQTYKNIEIIIINDGSPDESDEVCKKLEKNINKLNILNKKIKAFLPLEIWVLKKLKELLLLL